MLFKYVNRITPVNMYEIQYNKLFYFRFSFRKSRKSHDPNNVYVEYKGGTINFRSWDRSVDFSGFDAVNSAWALNKLAQHRAIIDLVRSKYRLNIVSQILSEQSFALGSKKGGLHPRRKL